MRYLLSSLLVACCAANAGAAAPASESFEWLQPIILSTPGAAIYRFELPAAAYAGSRRADLGDVRVVNGAGEVVPHAWTSEPTTTRLEVATLPLAFFVLHPQSEARGQAEFAVSVRQSADGTLVSTQVRSPASKASQPAGVIIDASSVKAARRALTLDWQPQAQGTLLPVTLEGSDDLRSWHRLTSAQLVDLRSGDQRLRQNRLELAGDGSRYFRLYWPATQTGIEVLAVAVETGTVAAPSSRRQWLSAGPLRPGDLPMSFLFDSPGIPVDALRLHLPDRNTVAPVTADRRPDHRSPWREAGSAVAYRLNRDGQEVASPPIAVCCGTDRHWRLRFDTRGGGIGQGTPELELGWLAQQGVFVARGDGPFHLAYGNAALTPTAFPVATLIPGYRADMLAALPTADFAAAVAQHQPAVIADHEPKVRWTGIALWAVLIGGVLLLAGMVWRLLGQLNAPPTKDS